MIPRFFLIFLSWTSFVAAQTVPDTTSSEVKIKGVKYFISFQNGPLIGCSDCAGGNQVTYSSALTQGIVFGNTRLGAAIGFDSYYRWQVMPLFGQISIDLAQMKSSSVYMQFQYGGSLAKFEKDFRAYGYVSSNSGRMVGFQIGYRMSIKDLSLAFQIGPKYQTVSTTYEYPTYILNFNGAWVNGDPSTTKIKESFNRFGASLVIGWR